MRGQRKKYFTQNSGNVDNGFQRINAYRIMWILVMFDLPTETKMQRKNYAQFRKKMMGDGFNMFQFSMYIRHCPSKENAIVHVNRVKKIMPSEGHIGIILITDKQFGMMEVFYGQKPQRIQKPPQQLEIF